MSKLREFIIKDVRCFEGEQRANIRPITLLVGENSTGKTSFLGSYRALHQVLNGHQYAPTMLWHLNFNVEPFQMGAFRDIYRSKRGKSNGRDDFMLGCSMDDGNNKHDIFLRFTEKGFEPAITSLRFQISEKSYLEIQITQDQNIILKIPGHTIKAKRTRFHYDELYLFFILLGRGFYPPDKERILNIIDIEEKEADILNKFLSEKLAIHHAANSITNIKPYWLGEEKSIAPLRSKPKRTYDPITEVSTPEGDHIPMLMMRLLRTKDKKWDTLHEDLVEFGNQSGLFSDIKIKGHGKQINDSFQLRVKVRTGPQSNIIDVGYGVNQILPILVEIIHSSRTTFLLQQPEVHLHPRAQAEFSTFLAKSVSKKGHSFLIETHSDYIIDRMRISVRDGIIKNPDDVSILYFDPEKRGGSVKIHNIKVDKQGNLIDTPPGYRDFFMKESDKLLGFS
ncbi:AAA family ATPase [Candidatus Spongiihabitans sp.]|uniref:AAA family ATPase n=1 Tax=Candidatus Spongiihabitans sp. TaxID=3101308 RepID=UPI003C7A44AB